MVLVPLFLFAKITYAETNNDENSVGASNVEECNVGASNVGASSASPSLAKKVNIASGSDIDLVDDDNAEEDDEEAPVGDYKEEPEEDGGEEKPESTDVASPSDVEEDGINGEEKDLNTDLEEESDATPSNASLGPFDATPKYTGGRLFGSGTGTWGGATLEYDDSISPKTLTIKGSATLTSGLLTNQTVGGSTISSLSNDIEKIVFVEDGGNKVKIAGDAGDGWFDVSGGSTAWQNLKIVDMSGADFTSASATCMASMFRAVSSLETVILPSVVNPNMSTLDHMFRNSGIKNLTIPNGFSTSNVTTMKYMFQSCSNLQTFTIPASFTTGKVTSMEGIFQTTTGMTGTLDLSNWDLSKVTTMQQAFSECYASEIRFSAGYNNCESCTTFEEIFYMTKMTTLDLSSFKTGNVTNMSVFLRKSENLVSVNLSSFNFSKNESFSNFFSDCYNLRTITWPSIIDTSKGKDFSSMFEDCIVLSDFSIISKFNTSAAENFSSMFAGCVAVSLIDISNFNFSSCQNTASMFMCGEDSAGNYIPMNLTSIKFPTTINVSSIYDMTAMFAGCAKLTSLDLSSWQTSLLGNAAYMFLGCEKLNEINLSQFICQPGCNTALMFADGSALVLSAGACKPNKLILGQNSIAAITTMTDCDLYDTDWIGSDGTTYATTNDLITGHNGKTAGFPITYTNGSAPPTPTPTPPGGGGGSSSGGGGSGGGGSGVSSGQLFNTLEVGIKSDTRTNDWLRNAKGDWYFIDANKQPYKGWYKDQRDQQWYYLDKTSGRMAQGLTEIDGHYYYFSAQDESPNWYYDKDKDKWYCHGVVTKSRGAMLSNETLPDGRYVNTEGLIVDLNRDEKEIAKAVDAEPNSWYRTRSGLWYYLDKNTTPVKGWYYDQKDNQWYYLDKDTGVMATGWREIDGKYFYFSEQERSDNWRYDEKSATWICDYGKVKSRGSMYKNERTPDGHMVGANGELIDV